MIAVSEFILDTAMEETKDRILGAALELFAAQGYSAVSTKLIARAASVNEVTLFRIFGSKRNLYVEVYDKYSVKVDRKAILKGVTYDLEGDLVHIGRAFAVIYNETSKVVRMSLKDVRDEFKEIDDDLKGQIGSITEVLAEYLREMKKRMAISKDPDSLAAWLIGIFYGYAMHLSKTDALDRLEGDIAEIMGIFAKGMLRDQTEES